MNIHLEHQKPPDRKKSFGRNILLAMTASGIIFIVEIWGSIKTGSLGLLSDAGHAFVDLSGLAVAYGALLIASRPASPQATYGYGRAEVLAAAINGLLVLGIAAVIIWRAILRLGNPLPELDTGLVLLVSGVSLAVNVAAAWFLQKDSKENINSKGAFVNVAGDALASLAVLVSAFLVRITGNTAWDTGVSFVVAAIIMVAAWNLLKGAVAILLERAPPHLPPEKIKEVVESLPDVRNVHDLHIWTLTPGHHSLSMHVSIQEDAIPRWVETIEAIEEVLLERFGLDHCTIQVEPEGHDAVSDVYDPVKGEVPTR